MDAWEESCDGNEIRTLDILLYYFVLLYQAKNNKFQSHRIKSSQSKSMYDLASTLDTALNKAVPIDSMLE